MRGAWLAIAVGIAGGVLVIVKPGWDSLESVASWASFFEVAGIFSLAVLVLMEIAAFQYGHREKELSAEAHRKEIAVAERRYGPRRITQDAAAAMVVSLKSLPPPATRVQIGALSGDTEANGLAEQIRQIVGGAGWNVSGLVTQTVMPGPVYGVLIHVGVMAESPVPVSPGPAELERVLSEAGIAAKVSVVPGAPGSVGIIVGGKPVE